MTLGDLIRSYREANRLSLEEFAQRASLTRPYIWMLEKNKNTKNNKPIIPSVTTLKKVALAMNMPLNNLLEALDENYPVRLEPRRNVSDSKTDNMAVEKHIAQKIMEYRKARDLTQKELGELVGVRDNTISGYEHNINDPGSDMLFKIALALHISINDLFPETEIDRALKLSDTEREHIKKYRELTEAHRKAVDDLTDTLYAADRADFVKKESQKYAPDEVDAG